MDFPIEETSKRHVFLTKHHLSYSTVIPTQSSSDLRIRRTAPILLSQVTPFHDSSSGTGFRIYLSPKRYIDLFTQRWETVEGWMTALAQVCSFTDIETDYRMVNRLGTGAFSRVYGAVDLNTNRPVAIKRIEKSQWKGMSGRLVKEVEILRKVRGEGVVALQAVYEDYNDVCLVLRLEPGLSLRTFISKFSPVHELQIHPILHNLLTTLQSIHSQGIIHNDIKPDNIILNPDSLTCCVVDFGLAMEVGEMKAGSMCGTPGYIAPEILHGKKGDEKVDVYGLGMVGWTMVKGKNPYIKGGDRRETLLRNREGRVRGEWWDGVSSPLKDLLEQMTCPEPSLRPTASECLQHPYFTSDTPVSPPNPKVLDRYSSLDSDFSTTGEDRPS